MKKMSKHPDAMCGLCKCAFGCTCACHNTTEATEHEMLKQEHETMLKNWAEVHKEVERLKKGYEKLELSHASAVHGFQGRFELGIAEGERRTRQKAATIVGQWFPCGVAVCEPQYAIDHCVGALLGLAGYSEEEKEDPCVKCGSTVTNKSICGMSDEEPIRTKWCGQCGEEKK